MAVFGDRNWHIKHGLLMSDYDIGNVIAPAPISTLMVSALALRAPRLIQRVPLNALPGSTLVMSFVGPRRKTYPVKSPVMGRLFDLGDRTVPNG